MDVQVQPCDRRVRLEPIHGTGIAPRHSGDLLPCERRREEFALSMPPLSG